MPTQKRRPRNRRAPGFTHRQTTDLDLRIIPKVLDYRFLPHSLLPALVGANAEVVRRRARNLYDAGYINRLFAPVFFGGEETPKKDMVYFLDNLEALLLLMRHHKIAREDLPWEELRYNREQYGNSPYLRPGQAIFLEHKIMIARFHAKIERGCRHSRGEVELVRWLQGARHLKVNLELPKLRAERTAQATLWVETEETERVSYELDAFFTLHFPHAPEGQRFAHFGYEADRKTMGTQAMRTKYRKAFHFVVRQKLHRQWKQYQIHRIRAILTETLDAHWADHLRRTAAHPLVSGSKPSPLFWFTTSQIFEKEYEVEKGKHTQRLPAFLVKPDLIFQKVWVSPVNDELVSLLD